MERRWRLLKPTDTTSLVSREPVRGRFETAGPSEHLEATTHPKRCLETVLRDARSLESQRVTSGVSKHEASKHGVL